MWMLLFTSACLSNITAECSFDATNTCILLTKKSQMCNYLPAVTLVPTSSVANEKRTVI